MYIGDLSILEILNLLSIGLTSYDYHSHVPSDIGTENLYLESENTKMQSYLERISQWTKDNQMKLNTDKTNFMVFNFSRNYQFNTRLRLEGNELEQVKETKLLGLIIRDDLSWKTNTSQLTRKAYSRMIILKKLIQFSVPLEDLIQIYILYIRSITEQSSVVWHPSLTKGEQRDLERTQKVALKIILGEDYTTYENALKISGLQPLTVRRTKLSLNFAKKMCEKQLN